jgi:hypothetical protein
MHLEKGENFYHLMEMSGGFSRANSTFRALWQASKWLAYEELSRSQDHRQLASLRVAATLLNDG